MSQNIRRLLEIASDLASQDEFNEALHIYNKILKDNPKNVSALIDKAVTLQRIGKNPQAIKLFLNVFNMEFIPFWYPKLVNLLIESVK